MPSFAPDRRAFLTAWRPKRPVLHVSCEQLYMRHMEARRLGRLEEFLADLTAEIEAAPGLRLTGTEWLDREAVRRDLEPILRRRRNPRS